MARGGLDRGPDRDELVDDGVGACRGAGHATPRRAAAADTSLYGSATLVGGTRDFTAFRLAVPHTLTTSFQVTLRSTYTGTCGDNGQCKEQGGGNDDKVRDHSLSTTVTVPVVPAIGPAFTQATSRVTSRRAATPSSRSPSPAVRRTSPTSRCASAPSRPACRRRIPGVRPASRPAGGPALLGGRTDHVAVRFDATRLPPGTYVVPLAISWTAAAPQIAAGTVTLVVQ